MTKAQVLEILRLLSALEACCFSNIPDYLINDLDKAVEVLTKEVLK